MNVLVVAAHPDDEVLGCGGSMAKHIQHGDTVSVIILGDGETARAGNANIKVRQQQIHNVEKYLHWTNLILEQLPDNQFDSVSLLSITKIVEKHLFRLKPDRIYTHHAHDLNIDHRLTFSAVLTACRPQPDFFVKEIFSFEVLSSTEWQAKDKHFLFAPTVYADITSWINQKITALEYYRGELRPYPHPRSVEGVKILAQYRGLEVGMVYAEAFELVRSLY